MSERDDRQCLNDMLSYAREAVELLGNASRADLTGNRVVQLALTRLVEIVGEAANRVTPATQQANSNIPWPDIIGMRNRLVHGYDVIDIDLLWDTVTDDLPELIRILETIIE